MISLIERLASDIEENRFPLADLLEEEDRLIESCLLKIGHVTYRFNDEEPIVLPKDSGKLEWKNGKIYPVLEAEIYEEGVIYFWAGSYVGQAEIDTYSPTDPEIRIYPDANHLSAVLCDWFGLEEEIDCFFEDIIKIDAEKHLKSMRWTVQATYHGEMHYYGEVDAWGNVYWNEQPPSDLKNEVEQGIKNGDKYSDFPNNWFLDK